MSLPHRGAEAVVTAGEWLGQQAVFKHRNPRSYRHPALERRLVAERLRAEARLLARAGEAGLPVPALYAVRLPDTLVMELLEGEPLAAALRRRDATAWLPQLGRLLRRLHDAGMVHGDPTTSNFIARGAGDAPEAGRGGVGRAEGVADAEAGAGAADSVTRPGADDPSRSGSAVLYVVDLGLGAITDDDEARATDLRVMLESLEAHHPELGAREPVLAAYGAREGGAATLARLRKLERRGRYNLERG